MSPLTIIIILIVPVILIAYFFYTRKRRQELLEAERLRQAYENALNSGSKSAAPQKGRAYYSYLRQGRLTIYDENAIANDLAAMD